MKIKYNKNEEEDEASKKKKKQIATAAMPNVSNA